MTSDTAEIGDWICFSKDGRLVIGIIHYIYNVGNSLFDIEYVTSAGTTSSYHEVRKPNKLVKYD